MSVNLKTLIKDWIQFLKNNKIVSMKSDPATGKLNYSRDVTLDDVYQFLDAKTDYSKKEIATAIKMVMTSNDGNVKQPVPAIPKSTGDLSTWMYHDITPGTQPNKNTSSNVDSEYIGKSSSKLTHNSVSDIDYRDVPPDTPQEPKKLTGPLKTKPRFKLRKVKEDITDTPGFSVSEADIENIFRTLVNTPTSSPINSTDSKPPTKGPVQDISADEKTAKIQEDMRKIKRLIRDVMTDSQRKSLWRMLNEKP